MYKTPNKVFIKSSNNSSYIMARYGYAVIVFYILTALGHIITKNDSLLIEMLKGTGVALGSSIVIGYIINIIKHDYNFKNIFVKEYVHVIGLIIGLFSTRVNYMIIVLAVLISLLIYNFIKGVKISSVLYGLLVIMIYKYINQDTGIVIYNSLREAFPDKNSTYNLLFGVTALSFIFSVLMFMYLFYKKSIKYGIVISYVITYIVLMFLYSVFSDKIWYIIPEIIYSNILFFSTFMLSDYEITPTLIEPQIIYGIILGIVSVILRLFMPSMAIIIAIILGIFIARPLDNISPKLKYKPKIYYLCLCGLFIIGVICAFGLSKI